MATSRPPHTIAVIGGGIAGLTTAYRLASKGLKVEVFEAARRLGGRIYTDYDSFAEQSGQFCEKGGEWIDSTHHEIRVLAHELGLDIQDISSKRTGVDLFYFDKHYYKPADFLNYQPGRDTTEGAYLALSNYIRADRDKAKRNRTYERELDSTSIHSYLLQGAIETHTPKWVIDSIDIAYKGEFGIETTKLSALLLINQIGTGPRHPFEVYGPKQDESQRVKGGNAALIRALEKKLEDLGVPIHSSHKLTVMDYAKVGGEPQFSLKFLAGDNTVNRSFDYVVCALPFTKLREVEGLKKLRQQNALSREKFDAIKNLQYGNIVKIMLGMNAAPWQAIGGANGSFRSDDPYLQNTWITSVGQGGDASILTVLIAGNEAQGKMKDMIDGCKEAFAGMLGSTKEAIFNPRKSFHAWPKDQFVKGSYSAFAPGQYTTMRLISGTPEAGGRLGFVGEHADPEHYGYMNGAVRSANRETERIIALESGIAPNRAGWRY